MLVLFLNPSVKMNPILDSLVVFELQKRNIKLMTSECNLVLMQRGNISQMLKIIETKAKKYMGWVMKLRIVYWTLKSNEI